MGCLVGAGWATRVGCSVGVGWTTKVGYLAGAGWATRVGSSACGTRGCEAWAVALAACVLRGTAWTCLGGTIWAKVVVSWTSPRMVTAVVAIVELRGGVAPPKIIFNLVDRRGPIS